MGYPGNERADQLAKKATEMQVYGPTPFLTPSINFLKKEIEISIYKEWVARWHALADCRQTRMFCPTPQARRTRQLLQCTRSVYSRVVRLLTGHNFMLRHEKIAGNCDSDTCRLCGEGQESSEHILYQCGVLSGHRQRTIGLHLADQLPRNLDHLLDFINDDRIVSLENQEDPNAQQNQ